MNEPQFNRDHTVRYGVLEDVAPSLRRITANNPGPFTFTGTGTYVLGNGHVAVIDPGPADPAHIGALVQALAGETISHILVTHTHVDHSPGCALLQQYTDAPTLSFAPHGKGENLFGLPADEGGDQLFEPDILLADGETVSGGDWQLQCLHTPGHCANHLCFYEAAGNRLFCGDHVMGWSTTIVSPPDGNMRDYIDGLHRLLTLPEAVYFPSHGAPIVESHQHVGALIAHRQQRIEQVLELLRPGPRTARAMVETAYPELPQAMHPAAERSVFATLLYLLERADVAVADTDQILSISSQFELTNP